MLFLSRQARTAAPVAAPSVSPSDTIDSDGTSLPFSLWALIYAASGLVALALEVVWFRLLTVMMKGTAFTFGTLLGVYLVGLGVGALVGSAVAPRIRRPAIAFLTIQACIGLTALGLIAVFLRRVDDIPVIATYLASYEPLNVRASVHALLGGVATADATPSTFLLMYIGVPVLLVLPPTLLMGAAFPVLQRVVQQDLHLVGRRVGMLLVANVVGSLVGTVATGLWLLDQFGTGGTLELLAVVSAGFGVLACYLALRDAKQDSPQASQSRAPLAVVQDAAARAVAALVARARPAHRGGQRV